MSIGSFRKRLLFTFIFLCGGLSFIGDLESSRLLLALDSGNAVKEKELVTTSGQKIPVSREVDVLVLGGTTAAVAAASESANLGAKTMLVTRFNYLGDELTATLRMEQLHNVVLKDVSDPLLQKLCNDHNAISRCVNPNLITSDPNRLPFSYTILEPLLEKHFENKTRNILSDGKVNSINETLQTKGPMTVIIDLHEKKELAGLVFVGFLRSKVCVLESVEIFGSDDGTVWKSIGFARQTSGVRPSQNNPDVFIWKGTSPVRTHYLKVIASHNGYSDTVLAGEIALYSSANFLDRLLENDVKRPDTLPRPLYIKRVLDETLLQSNVPFLYGTYIIGKIVDRMGNRRGVLVGNRAGCQAILAKKVLDFRFNRKLQTKDQNVSQVEFTVIGGEKVTFDSTRFSHLLKMEVESIIPPYYTSKTQQSQKKTTSSFTPWPIYRYTFTLKDPVKGGRAFAGDLVLLAEIESEIRLATYDKGQQFTSDIITPIIDPKGHKEELSVLLSTAREKGKSVALETKQCQMPNLDELTGIPSDSVPFSGMEESSLGEIRVLRDGLRSYDQTETFLNVPKTSYPITGRYDVIIVGGGTTGCPAAIAAARSGAKTLVIDLNSELGGLGTVGSVTGYYFGNQIGFTNETVQGKKVWLPAEKSHWWLEELMKAGGNVMTGVLGVGTITALEKVNGRTLVKGVLVASDFGLQVLSASVVIDTTGSGDMARASGAAMQFTTDGEITVQGAGLSPRGLGNFRMNNDYLFVDDTDPIDFTHAFVYGKVKYSGEFDQGKMLGTRERRRIVADFNVSLLDLLNGRTYSDTIVQPKSDFDSHGYTIDPFLELYHPIKREQYKTNVPYRCSLPKDLDGLLVGGLATGSHRDSLPLIRMQADLQNQGYALGYIAALAVKNKTTDLRKVDIKVAQKHLVEIGNLSDSVLADKDNYQQYKSELVAAVKDYPNDSRRACLIAWFPEDSIPLLKQEWQNAKNFESKVLYAKALAVLGDGTGETTLLEILKNTREWDHGWNFKAYQQFGSPSSPLDKTIMMLGRIGSKKAVPSIVSMLDKLNYEDDFSHHRACYLALEWIGDHTAAPALARHLAKPNMTGYVHHNINDAVRYDQSDRKIHLAEQSRRDSLKEIGAARVLYHLGDVDNIGRNILEEYSKDLRGHFARHAAETLKPCLLGK